MLNLGKKITVCVKIGIVWKSKGNMFLPYSYLAYLTTFTSYKIHPLPLNYLIMIYSFEMKLATYHLGLVLAHSLECVESLSLPMVNLQDVADGALAHWHLIYFEFL